MTAVVLVLLGLAALSWVQLIGRPFTREVEDFLWEVEARRLLPELYDPEDRS